jgi:hypothetical protein
MAIRRLFLPFSLPFLLAAVLAGCAGSLGMRPLEQGLQGTFTAYGPAGAQADCSPLKTQFEKDSCRHENERIIEEPYQATLVIRNVATRKAVEQALDAQGSYRVRLEPGTYEVCLHGECSDPIEVRMRTFPIYGQRLPRPPEADAPGKSAAGP